MTDVELAALLATPPIGEPGVLCTGAESLRITSISGDADSAVTLGIRFQPAGELVAQSQQERHVPNTDRTAASSDYPLGCGWLKSITAIASSGSPVYAHVFIRVDLVRGKGAGATVLQTLMQGPVSALTRRAWPGSPISASIEGPGAIRSITGTDPAANVEISETVPTGARWRPLSWRATLVTDANVANRVVDLIVDDGTNVIVQRSAISVQAASSTFAYIAAQGGDLGSSGNNQILIPWPAGLWLPAGFRIRTSTLNRQATDNWGAPQMLVEESLEAA